MLKTRKVSLSMKGEKKRVSGGQTGRGAAGHAGLAGLAGLAVQHFESLCLSVSVMQSRGRGK